MPQLRSLSPTARPLRAVLVGALLAAPLLLAGCSGEPEEEKATPEETLAAAKVTLDETSGVRLALVVDGLPKGVNGLLEANGIATHDPAFEGEIKVASGGITADAPIIAAGGKVYAVLPFTTKFALIDPADYSAPDPADLMSTEDGLSSLLTSAEDVAEGDQVRDGDEVRTTYTGTLSGEVVAGIIPSADEAGTFDATFTIGGEDRLDQVVMTGPFYPDADEVTYTIDVSDYDTEKDIQAP